MPAQRPTAWDRLAAAGMFLLLPLAPFIAAFIARDAAYVRDYAGSLRRAVRHVQGQQRARLVDRVVQARRRGWPAADRIAGSCTHCGACCLHHSCIFLAMDAGRSRCRIYGTPFFRRLVCAEYPRTAEDIARYACPSFTATRGDGAARPVSR